ncbi:MAG: TonB-dependent receptor [Acidobacteria bacterium]|nr:TonB-dependent receptor [Acidobacteriota bacterium]MCB9397856.1 TonB-dependent receptor [Acidobacteriota bacterium]
MKWFAMVSLGLLFLSWGSAQESPVSDLSLEELSQMGVKVETPGRRVESVADAASSIVVITRADIERYGYGSLDEILSHVLGLYEIKNHEVGGSYFGVRGFFNPTANAFALLINGIRHERIASDGAFYVAPRVSAMAIDRIEIVRGPMSILYGSGAFFGVINVITNKSFRNEEGILSVGLGSFSGRSGDLNMRISQGALNVSLNAHAEQDDGPDLPYSAMSRRDLANEFGVRRDSTADRWEQRSVLYDFAMEYKGFFTSYTQDHTEMGMDIFIPAAEEGGYFSRTYSTVGTGYKWSISSDQVLETTLTHHVGKVAQDLDWFTPVEALDLGGDHNHREDYDLDLTYHGQVNDSTHLTLGGYYRKIIDEKLLTYAPRVPLAYRVGLVTPAVSWGAYAQLEFQPSQKYHFVVGIRGEQAKPYETHYTVFGNERETRGHYQGDKLEPLVRLAGIFRIQPNQVMKFFYGQAINHPTMIQVANKAFAETPGDLGPEFIKTYELNHLWEALRFSTQISLFYNTLDELIVQTPYIQDEVFQLSARNAGKLETWGMEGNIQALYRPGLQAELGFSIQKTNDRSGLYESDAVAYSPELLIYWKGSYQSQSNRIKSSFLARYTGRMVPQWRVESPSPFEDRIADPVGGHLLCDWMIQIDRVLPQGLSLKLVVNNVFNKNYLYPTLPIQAEWADRGIAGDPRTFQLSLQRKFDF